MTGLMSVELPNQKCVYVKVCLIGQIKKDIRYSNSGMASVFE